MGSIDVREELIMERDPVCGMEVDPKTAPARSERNGKTYYFCSTACKQQFEQNPSQYAAA
jgi:Cu+-exporting ATPase